MATFPKSARLRTRREFQRVSEAGTRRVGSLIIIDSRPGNTPRPRLGIIVSRKFGKAHDRNRFKRIVREAFRLSQTLLPIGLDICVKPRSLAKEAKSTEIQKELTRLLK